METFFFVHFNFKCFFFSLSLCVLISYSRHADDVMFLICASSSSGYSSDTLWCISGCGASVVLFNVVPKREITGFKPQLNLMSKEKII